MTKITTDQVLHVADLSKLAFSAEEITRFTSQLGDIIDMVESLDEVDTTGVAFTMNVADNVNRMREDVPAEPVNRDLILREVPETQDGFIKVPAMLADGGDA
ncbi:Asp-tRNA(Asn)/Glu-tRNA(Gln) amidotransferase subunit GatC [Lactococcus termiticola]|uniref:Aspartyl/glutamyl-tRNA(Asn/Gln) amidotransferase subunit C n=1 Tax=Lactococcus termiticola TaxID=2169526 RepID=A0A2R5HFL3_9LACT|nr:Asp-tRNA(Asn)/Glu-tRNA(Gln) amidotransferase subunit GatC [Lactococcus termiticola]GBG96837.1 aspartyl/glutamyl-tRNA(Asn/Gln) amidotransferase subunit C [Lactococcus termiticola]